MATKVADDLDVVADGSKREVEADPCEDACSENEEGVGVKAHGWSQRSIS